MIRRSSFKSLLISPSTAKADVPTNSKDDAIKPAPSIFDNLSMILSILHFLAIPAISQIRRDPCSESLPAPLIHFVLTTKADLDI